MKCLAILAALALGTAPALAQTTPPDLQPITIPARQLAPLLRLLGALPYDQVAQVLEPIIMLEVAAQRDAAKAAAEPPKAAPTPAPTDAIGIKPTPGVTDSGSKPK